MFEISDSLVDALKEILELHSGSGDKIRHYCQHFGGSMEPSHDPAAPDYCNECGIETAWPCSTYNIASKAIKG